MGGGGDVHGHGWRLDSSAPTVSTPGFYLTLGQYWGAKVWEGSVNWATGVVDPPMFPRKLQQ